MGHRPSSNTWADNWFRWFSGLENALKQSKLQRLSWALRNQNFQPTCVAQAVVACIELMQVKTDPIAQRFSVRFLYQQMRKIGDTSKFAREKPGEWRRGFTSLANARDALRSGGICLEEAWPDTGPLLEPPSSAAVMQATQYKFQKVKYMRHEKGTERKPGISTLILDELRARRPVAIALPAFAEQKTANTPNNWTRDSVLLSGHVPDPLPTEVPVGDSGHAVCVVGYLPDMPELGKHAGLGGYFVFRNSLGEDFASLPPPSVIGRGYGTISVSHVEAHCWELLSLTSAAIPAQKEAAPSGRT